MILNTYAKAIKNAIFILSNPKQAFKDLERKSLEEVVVYYMRMLLLVAIAAGLINFLFFILRAFYLDIFVTVDIQYSRMINYSLSTSSSIILFYLFAGTFILFFVSIVVRTLIRKLKYTELLKVLMYSMAPFLLFGWLPASVPFIVWSFFLLFIGVKSYKTAYIKKNSVHNRV